MRALQPGDPAEIGGYQLRAHLGSGGMGTVYLASTPGGRLVAVKSIRSELTADDEFQERFRQEVRAARRVRGLYTAELLDADPDDFPPWLVTTYVPGPSLAQAVSSQGPVPHEMVPLLMAGVAEALLDIHAAAIVHRDLKPSNVMLSTDGPRVIDFGIAKALDSSRLTITGATAGSPECLTPEQVRGLPVTPAADVFSLGALGAYAAVGRPPFDAPNSAAMMYRVVNEAPALDGISAELRQLLEPCFAKDPGDRPSPAEVLKMCRALMPDRPAVFPQSWQAGAGDGPVDFDWAGQPVPAGDARSAHASGRLALDEPPPQPRKAWDTPGNAWAPPAAQPDPDLTVPPPTEPSSIMPPPTVPPPMMRPSTGLQAPAGTFRPQLEREAPPQEPEREAPPQAAPPGSAPPRPAAARSAATVWLMYGAGVLAIAALVVGLVTVPSLRTTLAQQHRGSTGGAIAAAVDLAVVVLVIRALTSAGTWLWAALDTGRGHRRPRAVAYVALAVSTLGLASSLLGPSPLAVRGLTLIGWLAGLAAVSIGWPCRSHR
jgi:serine/threonine protein kinase